MAHPRYSTEEIVRRGKTLYEQQLRPQVESGNAGKVLVINIETGYYEIDTDHLTASDRAAAKYPGAPLYAIRIGSSSVGGLAVHCRSVTLQGNVVRQAAVYKPALVAVGDSVFNVQHNDPIGIRK